ncbi:MAG: radical SAM protein [Candidatus Pacebacteria bacterium]|nr:radical SAM protein [Candidatus Paceibacterota bacterium]
MEPIYKNIKERFLFLYITGACSLRCKHCYLGNKKLNQAQKLSVVEIESILDYFKVTSGHDKLYLIGGEPTMHPQLDKIINMGINKGYSITISTNGLFEKKLFKILTPGKIVSLNISLDSWVPEEFQEIRSASQKDFYKIIDNIKSAVNNGLQVRIMCTVSKSNSKNVLGMIEFLEKLGVHILSFHNLGMTGNAVRFLKPLSPSGWMNFCDAIEKSTPTDKMAVYYPPTFIKKEDIKKYIERGYPGCPGRSLDRPHVLPNGRIYFCPLFMDYDIYGAKIKKGIFSFNVEKNSELNLYYRPKNNCMKCNLNNLCLGGCPAYSYIDAYNNFYTCDKNTIPLCILWTTYAWDRKPTASIHDFR